MLCVVGVVQGYNEGPYEAAAVMLAVFVVGVDLLVTDTHFSSLLLEFPSGFDVSSVSESTHVIELATVVSELAIVSASDA